MQLLEREKRKRRKKRESIGIIITTTTADAEVILRTPKTSGDVSGEGETMLMNIEATDQSIDEDQHPQKSEEEGLIEVEITKERGVEIHLQ